MASGTKVRGLGKELIFVVNKIDLVEGGRITEKLPGRVVKVSAKSKTGKQKLRNELRFLAEDLGKERVKIGVVGYANVGKSSIVSMLKGRKAARISSTAGYTRGVQWVGISVLSSVPKIRLKKPALKLTNVIKWQKNCHPKEK